MSRIISKTVYTFDELGPIAQARARDWYRDLSTSDQSFADAVIEDAARMASILGITLKSRAIPLMNGKTRQEPAIFWALDQQGAGASYEGTYSYEAGSVEAMAKEAPPEHDGTAQAENAALNAIAQALDAAQARHGYEITATIRVDGRSVHSRSMTIEIEPDLPEDEAETVEEALRDFADWIYCGLERELAYQQSDAAVDGAIEANDYEFDADGRRA